MIRHHTDKHHSSLKGLIETQTNLQQDNGAVTNNKLINMSGEMAWSNVVKKGFFIRHVAEVQAVTNFRVIWNSIKHGRISIYLKDIGGCVVLNQHPSAQFQSNSFYSGYHYRFSFGHSDSHKIGDVQVLDKQGQPVILFQQIDNPQNIKNLIQTEMKMA